MSKISLYEYQENAVKWCMNTENQCSIIAFDMGLGKTVITCELLNRKPLKTVILVPLSILNQWETELIKFTETSIVKYHGIKRKSQISQIKRANIIITTNRVFADEINEDHFANIERLVIDEAHRMRNKNGKAYKQLKIYGESIKNKVFLTGTPICNTIRDLISLICLSNLKEYNQEIFWRGDDIMTKLQQILPSILLRKTKNEVLQDILPKKTVKEIIIKIDEEDERKEYDEHVQDDMILRRILRMRQTVNYGKKIEKINDIIKTIPKNDKIIIFSSLTGILKRIQEYLTETSQIYHGKQTISERNIIINNFKTKTETRILLINLRSGGTGLNLIEANHVIIVEPYWNNSEQEQAINRIYRIGQKKEVMIYKLIAENSIEKWISLLQKSKLNISNYLIDNDKEYNMEEILNQREITSEVFRKVGELFIEDYEDEEIQEILSCDFHMEK